MPLRTPRQVAALRRPRRLRGRIDTERGCVGGSSRVEVCVRRVYENQQWALKKGQLVSSLSKLCVSSC
jgi:hypothetical protein